MIDRAGRRSRLVCPPLPAPLHLLAGVIEWDALDWTRPPVVAAHGRSAEAAPGASYARRVGLRRLLARRSKRWLVRQRPDRAIARDVVGAAGAGGAQSTGRPGGRPLFARVLAEMFEPGHAGARDPSAGASPCTRCTRSRAREFIERRMVEPVRTRRIRLRLTQRRSLAGRGRRRALESAGGDRRGAVVRTARAHRGPARLTESSTRAEHDVIVADRDGEPLVRSAGDSMSRSWDCPAGRCSGSSTNATVLGGSASHLSLVSSGADAARRACPTSRADCAGACRARSKRFRSVRARHAAFDGSCSRAARDVFARARPACAPAAQHRFRGCSWRATGLIPGCPRRSRAPSAPDIAPPNARAPGNWYPSRSATVVECTRSLFTTKSSRSKGGTARGSSGCSCATCSSRSPAFDVQADSPVMGRIEIELAPTADWPAVRDRVTATCSASRTSRTPGAAPHDFDALAAAILADLGDRAADRFA